MRSWELKGLQMLLVYFVCYKNDKDENSSECEFFFITGDRVHGQFVHIV